MKLTLEQTAAHLGKSPRQVRYMIEQRTLPAEKIGGRWFIDSDHLPAAAPQQAKVQTRKQQRFSNALEDALEIDKATTRRYSFRDLKAFQIGLPLYRQTCAAFSEEHPAAQALRRMLEQLAMGCHRFERNDKVLAYRTARDQASLAVCELALEESPAAVKLMDGLEQDLMAALAGLMRRHEGRRQRL